MFNIYNYMYKKFNYIISFYSYASVVHRNKDCLENVWRRKMDKILKIGVFGVFRGADYCRELMKVPNAKVVAICDRNEEMIASCKQYLDADCKIFSDYDEMLAYGIDAVILCNSFNKHAAAAQAALRKGIAVLSETAPATTLKECVELVECVEKTGAFYALAENYPFIRANRELARVYKSGIIGEIAYAEGEYVHPMDPVLAAKYQPTPNHWRSYLPITYYNTHALAPLMYMTDHMPKKVLGSQAFSGGKTYAGVMLVETDKKAIFRIFGSAHFGCMENWYRLGCTRGEIENVRGSNDYVRLVTNPWQRESGYDPVMGEESVYLPKATETDLVSTNAGRRTDDHGHWGGDQAMLRNFVDDILNNRTPYMDVYRSAAVAAVGIIGWRSILDGSVWKEIPDFRDKESRDRVRNDDLSPFPNEDGNRTLPSVYDPQ